MAANSDRNCPLLRRLLVATAAVAVSCALPALAQSAHAPDLSADAQSSSSSVIYQAALSTDNLLGGSTAPYHFSLAAADGSPQYGGNRQNKYPQYPSYQSKVSHIAIVAGGGFTTPVGNAAHGYETWGYNLDFGGGWNFNRKVGILFEYQFDRNKIPGATIAAVGAQGGNINSHLFLFDPIFYFYSGHRTGAYVTGGGGFSRKVTNFTQLQPVTQCYYYFCGQGYAPVTVAHFSSTQGAFDAGFGLYWKAFGQDSNGKLFAEARYVFVDSPKPTATADGEGTEGLIPVTFGIRW